MRNVFIAIGGSGTKVAEALVRTLAVGFPTRRDAGNLTSAGDKLEIWRIDPDVNAGAATDLIKAIDDYRNLQSHLGVPGDDRTVASSRWAADLETAVRQLDPLELPNGAENSVKTLGGILDSGVAARKSSPLLAPFYQKKDLDVWIDRGFYQKPFIGAAVMSLFAKSLEDDSSPAGKKAGLTGFANTPTNFFLCGSLHGGTGACGVPVMAQFLNRKKRANPDWQWRVGGGLLAPFVKPPMPPIPPLREGQDIEDVDIDALVETHGGQPAFEEMTREEKRQLVKQILLGFYADPDDMEARARQGLTYYKDHSSDYFDQLYVIGKPSPNQLKTWSNGGRSQRNPLNSADVVAAMAALNFFSGSRIGGADSYVIGSSNVDVPQEIMRVQHLPSYSIGDEVAVDPERVFLSTALAYHLILHQIPWHKVHESTKDYNIAAYYDRRRDQIEKDRDSYAAALSIISHSLNALVSPHSDTAPTGWSADDRLEIGKFLSTNQRSVDEVRGNMEKRFLSKEPKGSNSFGTASAGFTVFDFGKWCPPGDQFTRGEYLRWVWNEVFRMSAS